ncbi:MAG: 4Fe-4S dicluster domain-containing protein [Deferribacteraceae bacterium]|jgi:ferredoxin-type protein NapG|nr:4Fe-4S dicluster domain-containing protein [Deferribacteraceae bacterium]
MRFIDKVRRLLNENPFYPSFKINRMRPPGAVEEGKFMRLCIRCARCIEVCPYRSLHRAGASDGAAVGTPYIYAEGRGCYMCMLCTQVCPTGALDKEVNEREEMSAGRAVIDKNTCYDYLYASAVAEGKTDGSALYCNICYNSCPLQGKAIYLKNMEVPVVTESCTGCGICAERCPTSPCSINIIPTGMSVFERETTDVPEFKADFNTDNIVREWQ